TVQLRIRVRAWRLTWRDLLLFGTKTKVNAKPPVPAPEGTVREFTAHAGTQDQFGGSISLRNFPSRDFTKMMRYGTDPIQGDGDCAENNSAVPQTPSFRISNSYQSDKNI
ncbi:MAG TPA: hypothetical protein VKA78_12505, partial [Pyrinomonadaceae bacterium]|nr:hypothetical protein [Pyrinomonadaceae bacterium]